MNTPAPTATAETAETPETAVTESAATAVAESSDAVAETVAIAVAGSSDAEPTPAASAATAASAASDRTAVLTALRGRIAGRLSLPGDDTWDEDRRAWNLAVDQRPAAVVRAGTANDVVLAVTAAREAGLRVAPQGTGHNAGPLGDLSDTMLVRTVDLRAVHIVPEARIARCESGAEWRDVTVPAARCGLAALAGSSPDVGIAGYLLGGGVSWLGRSHGLAVNDVAAVEIVTADGLLRRVDATHEPELFWAVRGGGGNLGVVTAIELRLHPITEVYAGTLFFPVADSARVLQAWRAWTEQVPEQVTSVGRILQFPPIPELPDFLSGHSYVVIEAAMQLAPADADALLAPLRELGPVIDTFHPTPIAELDQLHMDPPQPVPGLGDGVLLSSLTADAVDAFVAAVGPGSGSALLSVEIRHLGGALARTAEGGGAISHLPAAFAVFGAGLPMSPEIALAIGASLTRLRAAIAPWTAAGLYQNFAELDTDAEAIWGTALDRLRAAKRHYDPLDTMRANHAV